MIVLLGAGSFGKLLWKVMGSVPPAMKLGLRVLGSAAIPAPPAPVAPQLDEAASDPVAAGLAAIAARDPAFAADAFLRWADQLPPQLAKGWAERDLATCRPSMTDDCWEGQQSLMERGLLESWRLAAGSVTFRPTQILAAAADADGDRVTVRVHAICPSEAARVIRGRRVAEWVEDWLFRRGVTLAPPASGITVRVLWRGDWKLDRMDYVEIHRERAA
jgi:predicted lipid-binding transport protein (Tim44 family)